MPNQQPQPASNGLDPQAVNLAKAIRHVESGGNFQATGKSGEYGAYQFEPATWDAYSKEAGVNVPLAQATPEQQNQVAYTKIKQWKDAGHNVGEIASMWNAGPGKPNAYLEGNAGVNQYGAQYDTAAYAQKVAQTYQQFKSGAGPQSQQQPQQQQPGLTGIPIVDSIANFAFPILGDVKADITGQSTKSPLQQAGDLGLSALWFAPGVGPEASLGAKIAGGAALGYGAGALSSLSQGQNLTQAISPNVSNVLGAVTGGAAGALIPKIFGAITGSATEEGAVNAVQSNLQDELSRTVPTRTLMQNMGDEESQRAISLIAHAPDMTPGVEGSTFATQDAIDAAYKRIGQLGDARAAAIDAVTPDAGISLDELAQAAKNQITTIPGDATAEEIKAMKKLQFGGESQAMLGKIDKIVNDIKASNGGRTYIDASELEAMKEALAENSGVFKYSGDIGDANGASILSGVAKDKIEELANQAGFPGMKEYNQYIADHYNAIKLLQRLGKQTVKNGRLGAMLKGHVAGGVGAMAASAAGGGFLGTIAGGLGGEAAGHWLSKVIGDTSISNPLRDSIIAKIAQEDPEVVQQLLQFAGQSGQVAPMLQPQAMSRAAGLIPSLLQKTVTRGATSIQTR